MTGGEAGGAPVQAPLAHGRRYGELVGVPLGAGEVAAPQGDPHQAGGGQDRPRRVDGGVRAGERQQHGLGSVEVAAVLEHLAEVGGVDLGRGDGTDGEVLAARLLQQLGRRREARRAGARGRCPRRRRTSRRTNASPAAAASSRPSRAKPTACSARATWRDIGIAAVSNASGEQRSVALGAGQLDRLLRLMAGASGRPAPSNPSHASARQRRRPRRVGGTVEQGQEVVEHRRQRRGRQREPGQVGARGEAGQGVAAVAAPTPARRRCSPPRPCSRRDHAASSGPRTPSAATAASSATHAAWRSRQCRRLAEAIGGVAGEVPDRPQQSVPRLVVAPFGHDERLVDEAGERLGDVGGVELVVGGDPLDGVEPERAAEHGQPPQQRSLVLEQQVVAPLDRRRHRAVADGPRLAGRGRWRRGDRRAGRRAGPARTPAGGPRRARCRAAAGRRARRSSGPLLVGPVDGEAVLGVDAARAEEGDGVVEGERLQLPHRLAGHVERRRGSSPGRAGSGRPGAGAWRPSRRRRGRARSCRARAAAQRAPSAGATASTAARTSLEPSGRPPAGPPNAASNERATPSGPAVAYSSSIHAPSRQASSRRRATSVATRVLPTPPGPTSVTSRRVATRAAIAATSSSRPTNELSSPRTLVVNVRRGPADGEVLGGGDRPASRRRVLLEDALLQLAQLDAGLDAHLVDQRGTRSRRTRAGRRPAGRRGTARASAGPTAARAAAWRPTAPPAPGRAARVDRDRAGRRRATPGRPTAARRAAAARRRRSPRTRTRRAPVPATARGRRRALRRRRRSAVRRRGRRRRGSAARTARCRCRRARRRGRSPG